MNLLIYFQNLKIRAKLVLGFAIMVICMAIIGYSGYNGAHHVMGDLDEIFAVRMPGIDYLLEADRDLQQLLVAERSMIFASAKSDQFKELVAEYEKNLEQSEERWKKFTALAATPEVEAIIPEYNQARKEWLSISRKVVGGRIADTREGRRIALDLSLGEAKTKFETMRNHLDKLTEINLSLAAEAQQNASSSYRQAKTFLLSILAIGILVGIAMAWAISSSITRPVNDAVKGLRDIAEGEGDLTKRLMVKSKDEVGELSTWFNTFLDKLQAIIKEISDNTVKIGTAAAKPVRSFHTDVHGGRQHVGQIKHGGQRGRTNEYQRPVGRRCHGRNGHQCQYGCVIHGRDDVHCQRNCRAIGKGQSDYQRGGFTS